MSLSKYGVSEVENDCYDAITKADELHAVAIIVLSHTNETARWLSKYHTSQPIFVCTDNTLIVNQLDGYYRSCHGILIDKEMTVEELVSCIRKDGYELDAGSIVFVNDWNSPISISDLTIE